MPLRLSVSSVLCRNHRFGKCSDKLLLIPKVIFAHIACKGHLISLTQFRFRVIGAWLLMQSEIFL